MPTEISLVLSPQEAADPKIYTAKAVKQLGISADQLALVRILGRSIDARSRQIRVNLRLQLFIDPEGEPAPVRFDYPDVTHAAPVVIVGAGPAGLFAALRLIERGIKPILVERGKDVSARKRDIAQINRNGAVDPDSNYAFGEGGAGAYSDGKLFTRSKKRGDYRKALEVLHAHGADESILYDAHPHIGTDRLPRIIAAIRQTIRSCGGEILFETRVADLLLREGRAVGVVDRQGNRIEAMAVILATGHSARDVYKLLNSKGVRLEAKPFAMGVRVEHPQSLIDTIQYHLPSRGEYLPAAAYSLVSQIGGRGVYSFCMCPGGFVVPALTQPGEAVVNGMSPSGRNSVYANAGIVTEIRAEDYAHLTEEYGALAALRFQEEFEQAAFAQGGGRQVVPGQRLADFVAGRVSKSLPATSYHPGAVATDMYGWMPHFIGESLRGGFASFGQKMRGFVTNEALILGVESRTSSPVRIPRDPLTLMHPETDGLFPSGEGAGYAGGIVSAALDGERSADRCADYCR
ncbi:MAG: FAD-binding protein [Rikenellaceae bacterium]|jgi:uncharacterized FAD-dependent dehydrogenase|nr:FAD-binding protein [Rikenellaceae bacterium]